MVVNSRIDRTHTFARRGFAMLTQHRLVHRLHIINPFFKLLILVLLERGIPCALLRIGGVVTINPQPVHFATAIHEVFADDWNVVLALTRDDACAATHAAAQINRHAPLVMSLLLGFIERVRIQRLRPFASCAFRTRRHRRVHLFRKIRMRLELFQVRLAHNRATFHAPVRLRAGDRILVTTHFFQRRTTDDVASLAAVKWIGVETCAHADAAHFFATVTQCDAE